MDAVSLPGVTGVNGEIQRGVQSNWTTLFLLMMTTARSRKQTLVIKGTAHRMVNFYNYTHPMKNEGRKRWPSLTLLAK